MSSENSIYYRQISAQNDMSSVMNFSGADIWQEIIDNQSFIESQYDVIAGRLPQNKDEIIIQVDKYNQITDITLLSLGVLTPRSSVDTLTFDDLLSLEYKLILNDDLYSYDSVNDRFVSQVDTITADVYNKGLTLKVVGIVRVNELTNTGSITGAIGYTKELTDYILEEAGKSEIVFCQKSNPTKDPLTGQAYPADQNVEEQYYIIIPLAESGVLPSQCHQYLSCRL